MADVENRRPFIPLNALQSLVRHEQIVVHLRSDETQPSSVISETSSTDFLEASERAIKSIRQEFDIPPQLNPSQTLYILNDKNRLKEAALVRHRKRCMFLDKSLEYARPEGTLATSLQKQKKARKIYEHIIFRDLHGAEVMHDQSNQ